MYWCPFLSLLLPVRSVLTPISIMNFLYSTEFFFVSILLLHFAFTFSFLFSFFPFFTVFTEMTDPEFPTSPNQPTNLPSWALRFACVWLPLRSFELVRLSQLGHLWTPLSSQSPHPILCPSTSTLPAQHAHLHC